jgi:thiamine biosynthesis protein ThiI
VKYELVIIRYGEIGLKAKQTRRRFEDILVNNIKKALETKKISNQIKIERGRIFVYTDQIKESLFVLKNVFGITSISPSIKTSSDLNEMEKLAIDITKNQITDKDSFALRVTREGNHSYTSQDVAILLGDAVRRATNAKVNLTKPDFTLFIEIRGDNAFFYKEKIIGVGGLPLKTQGNVLSLIDSDASILAAWYMMHRGCKIIFVSKNKSFNKKIKLFLKNWYTESKVLDIDQNKIGDMAIENHCEAIITGHSLSKKSLEEIKNLEKETNLLILNPLIAMNEEQIKYKMKEIGLKK